ncbi:MAG: AmpG family muropeptide MFS transporter [Alphaproteobacteria bacterium]
MTDHATLPRKSALTRFREGLAVYGHAPVLAIFLLGFSSGLPLALTTGTLTFWLSEEGLTRTAIGLFAIVGTPYSLKFLWAPLMDRLPIPWLTGKFGRRRSWLLVTQAALMVTIVGLGFSSPADDLWRTALFCVLVAFFSASQDIVVDAFRIESLEEKEQGAGAAAYVWGYRIAMLLSGGGALALAAIWSWQAAYLVMGLFMVIGMGTVLWRKEPAEHDSEDAKERRAQIARFLADRPQLQGRTAEFLAFLNTGVVGPFAEFMKRKGWWLILLFIVFFKFGDAVAGVMTNPLYQEIGFTKLQVAGIVKSWGLAATLVGLGIGGAVMGALGMVRALWIAGILQMLSNLMFAALVKVGADPAFLALTIGVENLAGGLGTAVFVAYLSSLCNISYTATQYALLSSFMALARTWMSASGGYFADELGWYSFFIATTIAAVPGLVLLWFVTRQEKPADEIP